MQIPFNKPYLGGKELWYIAQAHTKGQLAGDGAYTKRCQHWLEQKTGSSRALLTHSCTAALEMSAVLANIKSGDEIIMPSYTFVSTANAFVLRGGVPVFVDIRPDTLNIDETLIEAAITAHTRAIMVVHYAGIGCEMDALVAIAKKHGLLLIEDAAQAIMASYRGQPLGSFGSLGAMSFHETKNISSGEGGALLVNDQALVERAEIIREKGTNRSKFFRGQVDKYTWVDIGSSYLPGEIISAFLYAQMEEADTITRRRLAIWNRYHAAFASAEEAGLTRRPCVPTHCTHNAHMYYLLLPDLGARSEFISRMSQLGVQAVWHYVPLHSSPAGQTNSRVHGNLSVTDDISDRLVRLPLWVGVEEFQDHIIGSVNQILGALTSR
ncbi:MAG: dTDP-4-amino-4,6-dideoxygalactose transaminase [Xanthomonadales bacterium]|nr:dTDP-4-amino-4,6-dideoxygalactose transaminase [Xanthomonadales bacterium]